MILTPAHAALMARYNIWQNSNLMTAAETLEPAARRQDRGGFFGSISGTLNHLIWADLIWMARFEDSPRPEVGLRESAALFPDWAEYRTARLATDRRIQDWADRLTPEALTGDLTWYSGAVGQEIRRPLGLCVAHLFNHQTHHRGQVHAMLTAAGARLGDTDLFLIPEEIGL